MVSSTDHAYVAVALGEAEASTHYRYKMGAVLVAGGRVRGRGPNIFRNPARVAPGNSSFHAECVALRGVERVSSGTIYVARVSAEGQPVLARPCITCQGKLFAAGVRRMVFTTEFGPQSERLRESA